MLHLLKNKLALTGLALFLAIELQAQVKFNLSLLADQQTYLVSMIPESSWAAPQNMVGSAQVCLQLQAGKPFLAGNIKSLVAGTSWSDNVYVEKPASASESQFICFSLNEMGTKNIPFSADVETPLFSFRNLEPGCVGVLQLVENADPVVQAVVNQDHINITQNISVLGARGNAYAGLANAEVDCTVLNIREEKAIVSNLRVFPVPATDGLQIQWENPASAAVNKLLVTDMLGRQMTLESTSNTAGEQQFRLDVAAYPTGLYMASLINTAGERQSFRFIVTRS